jgi:acetylcholinesterase
MEPITLQSPILAERFTFSSPSNTELLFYGYPSGNEPHELGVEDLGLRHQRLAFQWVQENTVDFGGDAAKLTVMGERCVSRTTPAASWH